LIRLRTILSVLPAVLLVPALLSSHAQQAQSSSPSNPDQSDNSAGSMRRHYELAYHLQEQGNLAQADQEHIAFLLDALESVATGYANTGDFARAEPVYEEALALSPNRFSLLYSYARAAMDANDPQRASALLSPLVAPGAPPLTRAQKSHAQKILAEALFAKGHLDASLAAFQALADADPSYENIYALGVAILGIKDNVRAKPVFDKLLHTFGDTPYVRMDIGRAYGQYGYPEDAVRQFQRVLALDPHYPEAHYSLGAAYFGDFGANADLAEKEFRAELARNPNDQFCYPQLARIALARNNDQEAEIDLRRATELDPYNPSNFLFLGTLYYRLGRMQEAEPAFRRAIALTVNPDRNNWEIHRAHYFLGRILVARGDKAEAETELALAQSLFDRQQQELRDRSAGIGVAPRPLTRTRIPSPEDVAAFQEFLHNVSPLIAAGYNNLGVHAAMASQFDTAAKRFGLAQHWNPSLEGVDRNWARAAFAAHDCAQAIPPLERALQQTPADTMLTSILAACHTSANK
jgi:tetratricopeptide (TPR) repeat protein